MKKIKTVLSVVFFVVLIIYTVAFAAKNNQVLALELFFVDPIELPVSIWMGLMLIVGAILGFASNMLLFTKQKMTIRRLKTELSIKD